MRVGGVRVMHTSLGLGKARRQAIGFSAPFSTPVATGAVTDPPPQAILVVRE